MNLQHTYNTRENDGCAFHDEMSLCLCAIGRVDVFAGNVLEVEEEESKIKERNRYDGILLPS